MAKSYEQGKKKRQKNKPQNKFIPSDLMGLQQRNLGFNSGAGIMVRFILCNRLMNIFSNVNFNDLFY